MPLMEHEGPSPALPALNKLGQVLDGEIKERKLTLPQLLDKLKTHDTGSMDKAEFLQMFSLYFTADLGAHMLLEEESLVSYLALCFAIPGSGGGLVNCNAAGEGLTKGLSGDVRAGFRFIFDILDLDRDDFVTISDVTRALEAGCRCMKHDVRLILELLSRQVENYQIGAPQDSDEVVVPLVHQHVESGVTWAGVSGELDHMERRAARGVKGEALHLPQIVCLLLKKKKGRI